MKRVVMVHTAHVNEQRFQALADELLPGVKVEHIVDEGMLQETIAAGAMTQDVQERFVSVAERLRASGVDAVVLTCSSIGAAVDAVGSGPTPVVRIDTAMADTAVQGGQRIGIAATLPTTLQPTAELIYAAARRAGRAVEVRTALADGAFQALATDAADHDRRVRATLDQLGGWADVIVLAQASMTRALSGDSVTVAGREIPVLTSPRLGMQRLATLLDLPTA